MNSSPDAHRAYVEDLDLNLDGKLRPLIRLLKAWKHFREVPISSFYLELRCVEYAFDETMIVYTVDFPNVLQVLWDDQFSDVRDPKRISGYVPARLTYAGRKAADYAREAGEPVVLNEQVAIEKARVYAPVKRSDGIE